MKENPLYVPLDEPRQGRRQDGDSLDALRRRLDEARAKAGHPQPLVSADGRLQLIIVRADFNGGDLDRGARLAAALGGAVDATAHESGPSVRFGVAGDVVRALAEQNGLVRGMAIATLLTVVAVLVGMLLYFRLGRRRSWRSAGR